MKKSLLVIGTMFLLTVGQALAQGGPGDGGPVGPPEPDPPIPADPTAVPIDGGAGLLLASGAAYGIKKLRDRRRAKTKK